MVLSSTTIRNYIESGLISVKPHFDESQLRPFGLRVHLGSDVLIPEPYQKVDLSEENINPPTYRKLDLTSSNLILQPGDFVLGCTVESFKIDPTLLCRIDGRSTLARLGLLIHCTAEIIDNIHQDYRVIVLEIANVGKFEVVIPYLHGIGMAVFETISTPVDATEEQEQYKNQLTVQPPNLGFSTPTYVLD